MLETRSSSADIIRGSLLTKLGKLGDIQRSTISSRVLVVVPKDNFDTSQIYCEVKTPSTYLVNYREAAAEESSRFKLNHAQETDPRPLVGYFGWKGEQIFTEVISAHLAAEIETFVAQDVKTRHRRRGVSDLIHEVLVPELALRCAMGRFFVVKNSEPGSFWMDSMELGRVLCEDDDDDDGEGLDTDQASKEVDASERAADEDVAVVSSCHGAANDTAAQSRLGRGQGHYDNTASAGSVGPDVLFVHDLDDLPDLIKHILTEYA